MKKVMHGLMAAAVAFGLTAAPAFAAMAPRVETGSQIVKVAQSTKKKTTKKVAAKKAPAKKQTAKKTPAKKKPAATG